MSRSPINPQVTTGRAPMNRYSDTMLSVKLFRNCWGIPLSFNVLYYIKQVAGGRQGAVRESSATWRPTFVSSQFRGHCKSIYQIKRSLPCFELIYFFFFFKSYFLKKTQFPDYGPLYRRTRKYKFWTRRFKSYFRSLFTHASHCGMSSSSFQGHCGDGVWLCSAVPTLTFLTPIPVLYKQCKKCKKSIVRKL